MGEQNHANIDKQTDTLDSDHINQQIVKLLLTQPSITDAEIGKNLGVSRQTINKRRNSEAVRARLGDILSISEKRIRRLVALSLDQMETFLTDPDPRLRMASALAILKLGTTLVTPTPSLFDGLSEKADKQREWVEDKT